MKAKKVKAVCAMAAAASLLLTGCQNSAQTEEEIVVPRQEDSGEAGGAQEGEGRAAAGEIADQVQAPEHYAWEGGSGKIKVKVDADLEIPDGAGFKSYKVAGRVFYQEDYDRVNRTLLGGAALWERDWEKMGDSNGFTAAEIDEKIAELEEQRVNAQTAGRKEMIFDEGKGRSYDEVIDEWKSMREAAPDTVMLVAVPAIVSYEEDGENMEKNMLMGMATVEGKDFMVSLDNIWSDSWRWVNFLIRRDGSGSFEFAADGEEARSAGIFAGEARQRAQEAAAAMGFEDFAISGEGYCKSFSYNETDGGEQVDEVGYAVYFTRLLDGIPVTYTQEIGAMAEDDKAAWPYERLKMVYTKDGLAEFIWSNPYEVEKISDDYRFLLPFSEIQGIFEEMLIKKYEDFYAKNDIEVHFEIDAVRLGYMRVMEKGNAAEGEMLPVWDFFGSETIIWPDLEEPYGMNEPYVMGGPYESWITINALDGTIIDRGVGY